MPNLLLLTLLTAFPALSTDMYLPALPTLQETWSISMAEANLSLVVFFACFSFFLLVHGPLSDRFGRRPVLLAGVSLYIAGSFLCGAAGSIGGLVAARVVQAIGAAAASALALALAKDLYEGIERQKVLALIGVILPLCPMLAPMLGGYMLKFASWRVIFFTQGILALSALYGCLRLKEPDFTRTAGGVLAVIGRYRILARNRRFMAYSVAFSFMAIAFFGFIAASADIYISRFGYSEEVYGLFFGLNALGLMSGSFLCSRLCVGFSSSRILTFSLLGLLLAGGALTVTAGATPFLFAAPMFAISFFVGLSRPISNHMVLEQVRMDVGAASSFFSFLNYMSGAVAMAFISLDFSHKARVIGILGIIGAIIPLAMVLAAPPTAQTGATPEVVPEEAPEEASDEASV